MVLSILLLHTEIFFLSEEFSKDFIETLEPSFNGGSFCYGKLLSDGKIVEKIQKKQKNVCRLVIKRFIKYAQKRMVSSGKVINSGKVIRKLSTEKKLEKTKKIKLYTKLSTLSTKNHVEN